MPRHAPDDVSPRTGASLVDLLFHLAILTSAIAGALAARQHGPVALIQGLVCGLIVGGVGIIASMLFISGFLALIGSGENSGPLRRIIDNLAAVVLVLLLLSAPVWASLATTRFVNWLHVR